MYDVLLVDDEKTILRGIATLVDWESTGTRLIGTAQNGELAWNMIQNDPPHIVISDIKMPGLNGLDLIRNIKQHYPHIHCLILSGYEEFSFAKQAMAYGVNHYLLKPCNEHKIAETLRQVVAQLEEEREKETALVHTKNELQRVLPHAKEHLLQQWVSEDGDEQLDEQRYKTLFADEEIDRHVRLVLLAIEGSDEMEQRYVLKKKMHHGLNESLPVVMSSLVGEKVIIVFDEVDDDVLMERCIPLLHEYEAERSLTVSIAVSDLGPARKMRHLYKQARQRLKHRPRTNALMKENVQRHPIVRQMMNLVYEHYADEAFSLNVLANDLMFMSADYLGRLFKQTTGLRFTQFLIEVRIAEAMRIIERMEEVKVFEVAEQVGFGNSPQYFSQVFRKKNGCSPSEYKHRLSVDFTNDL